MKKISKILALVLAIAMMATLFAACGDKSASTPAEKPAESDSDKPADSTPADDGKVYTITFDYPNPEASVAFRALSSWADHLREQSNGRLDIQIHPAGALGSLMDCAVNCETGVTDGFWSGVTIYAGMFPLTEVFGLPMIGAKNYKVINDAMNAMFAENEALQAEWSNYKLVALHSSAGSPILSSKKIESVEELQGMNLRMSNAYTTQWFNDHGINPVSCGINDGYESISKSVIQGGLFFFDQVESSALYEVIDSLYVGQTIYPLNMICLNKDKYESLPADLQQLIDESADFFIDESIVGFDEQQANMIATCENAGVNIIYEDEASLEWLQKDAEKAWALWVENMNKQGYDGQGILDAAMGYIEQFNANY